MCVYPGGSTGYSERSSGVAPFQFDYDYTFDTVTGQLVVVYGCTADQHLHKTYCIKIVKVLPFKRLDLPPAGSIDSAAKSTLDTEAVPSSHLSASSFISSTAVK